MRVGIYTGEVVAGSVGSDERLSFTVPGESVNTSARLESAGKEVGVLPDEVCTILIGEATYERLWGSVKAIHLGPVKLKGKANESVVYQVMRSES